MIDFFVDIFLGVWFSFFFVWRPSLIIIVFTRFILLFIDLFIVFIFTNVLDFPFGLSLFFHLRFYNYYIIHSKTLLVFRMCLPMM